MLNINRKLLSGCVDENEYWVLCHIAKYIDRRSMCFPSRETLRKSTGFGRDKLDKTLKLLCEKGLLGKEQRKKKGILFSTNKYVIKTDYIGVFIDLKGIKEKEIEAEPLTDFQGTAAGETEGKPVTDFQGTENQGTENQYAKYCKSFLKYCKIDFKYCEEESALSNFEKLIIELEKEAPVLSSNPESQIEVQKPEAETQLPEQPAEEIPQVAALPLLAPAAVQPPQAPAYTIEDFCAAWGIRRSQPLEIEWYRLHLPAEDLKEMAEHVPWYIANTSPNGEGKKKYRKSATNYLRQQEWATNPKPKSAAIIPLSGETRDAEGRSIVGRCSYRQVAVDMPYGPERAKLRVKAYADVNK